MTRIWKLYDFDFKSSNAHKISMASYPGMVMSGDDFYITDQELAVMETTHSVYNVTLFKKFMLPTNVLHVFRTMVAHRLATTAPDWVTIFEKNNDGAYSNQWMVLDYKLFTPGKPLKPDTFWISEQLPGSFVHADMTSTLNDAGYWPSYNVPYFLDIYKLAGWEAMQDKYGLFFNHTHTNRAQLFARDHHTVKDMPTMKAMMRE